MGPRAGGGEAAVFSLSDFPPPLLPLHEEGSATGGVEEEASCGVSFPHMVPFEAPDERMSTERECASVQHKRQAEKKRDEILL